MEGKNSSTTHLSTAFPARKRMTVGTATISCLRLTCIKEEKVRARFSLFRKRIIIDTSGNFSASS